MKEDDPRYVDLATVQPLDVEAETQRVMLALGLMQSALIVGDFPNAVSNDKVQRVLWVRIPFIKALNELARNHPQETLVLWKRALQEPMPFGGAPLGLPEGEEPGAGVSGPESV